MARGRGFAADEVFTDGPATVAVLSPGAAFQLFGDVDPLGKTVVQPGRPTREYIVVGVAADVRSSMMRPDPAPVVYLPFSSEFADLGAVLMVRTNRPPAEARRALQTAASSLDPSVPLYRDQTLEQIVDAGIAEQRLFAWLLSLLGVIAFALAAVGLYGLVSQMVAERAREFGIRIAIGAGRRAILQLLLNQAGFVTIAGTAMGLSAAALSRNVLDGYLFGVTSGDPVTYVVACVLLIAVVALALIGPARTALKVEPISVLRSE
jgi:hypothetical protein